MHQQHGSFFLSRVACIFIVRSLTAALDQKPHSNRSRTFSKLKLHVSRTQNRNWRPNIIHGEVNQVVPLFCAKMFVYIFKQFVTFTKSRFSFYCPCDIAPGCFQRLGKPEHCILHLSHHRIKAALDTKPANLSDRCESTSMPA